MGHPHTPSKHKVTEWGQEAQLPQNTPKTSHRHAELHLGLRGVQRCRRCGFGGSGGFGGVLGMQGAGSHPPCSLLF